MRVNPSAPVFKLPPQVVQGVVFSENVRNEAAIRKQFIRKLFRKKKEFDYRQTVRKRVQIINEDLANKGMRYEFEVKDDDNDLVINLLVDGLTIYSRRIDNDNFGEILDKLSNGSGFIFDD
jgi:hypothetical protein